MKRDRPLTKEQVKKLADKAERVEKDGHGNLGRPTIYTDNLADEICDRIAAGESLRTICDDDTMPNRRTVMRWLDANPVFATKHARARKLQADVMDEKILAVADASTNETAQADRVKIAAYQWRAARLDPKKYGDRTILAGDPEAPIETRQSVDLSTLSDEELAVFHKLKAAQAGKPVSH